MNRYLNPGAQPASEAQKLQDCLEIIRQALHAGRSVVSKGRVAFDDEADPSQRYAGAFAVIQFGEAVARLPEDFIAEHPSLPWKGAKGLRDVAAHYQLTFQFSYVWEALVRHFPAFEAELFPG